MDHEPKQSWIDNVPPRAALGIGAALGVGVIGVIGFLVVLPSVIKARTEAPTNAPTNVATAPPNAPAPTEPPPPAQPVNITVTDADHVRGPSDAKVTIVEWSDFQCPFCSRFHPTVQQAMKEYEGKVRWVYRHFPLDSIHPNARPAAEASECAAEQGKFWEFADELYAKQESLGPEMYKTIAKQLKLDAAKFDDCVKSRKYQQRVTDDEQAGLAASVRGTPGSFVNGVEVPGAVPLETLKGYIDAALAK